MRQVDPASLRRENSTGWTPGPVLPPGRAAVASPIKIADWPTRRAVNTNASPMGWSKSSAHYSDVGHRPVAPYHSMSLDGLSSSHDSRHRVGDCPGYTLIFSSLLTLLALLGLTGGGAFTAHGL